MPDESRKRLWYAIEHKRLSMEDTQTRRIHDALQDSIQPILQNLREFGPGDAASDTESALNGNAIRQGYIDLYKSVGVPFAWDTFNALTSRKQEDTIEDMWLQRLEEFATTEAGERIVNVSNYTVEQIRAVLNKGIQEGWGIEKIARQMQSDSVVSRVRARRISRTEIISASNEGSTIGARATSLNLKKEWLATMDSRVRATHAEADGQERGMDESFRVGGYEADYPGDPSLPADESINCRCTVIHREYD